MKKHVHALRAYACCVRSFYEIIQLKIKGYKLLNIVTTVS